MREANIALLPFRSAFRKAVQHSSRIFAVNSETAAVIRRAGNSDVELFLDCGVNPELLQSSNGRRGGAEQMTVLWGGTIGLAQSSPLSNSGHG